MYRHTYIHIGMYTCILVYICILYYTCGYVHMRVNMLTYVQGHTCRGRFLRQT